MVDFKFCPKCGTPVKEGAKFCGGCGANLEELENVAKKVEETVQNEPKVVPDKEKTTYVAPGPVHVEPKVEEVKPEPIIEKPEEPVIENTEEPVIENIEEPKVTEEVPIIEDEELYTPDVKPKETKNDNLEDVVSKALGGASTVASTNTAQKNKKEYNEPVKKQKSFVPIVILVIVLILGLLLGGSYLFRDTITDQVGNTLSFIPWLKTDDHHDDKDDKKDDCEKYGNCDTSKPTSAPTSNATAQADNTNASNITAAIQKALNKDSLSASDYAQIKTIVINGNDISIDNQQISNNGTNNGDYNLQDLINCTNLDNINIVNVNSLTFPINNMPSVTSMYIDNVKVITNENNLNMFSNLTYLTINNANLTSLAGLSSATNLTDINVSNNLITSTIGIENLPKLASVTIYGNNIWNYEGLKNVKNVTITENGSLYTMERDSKSQQIKVLVKDLNIRTSPEKVNDDNKTGDHCVTDAYYYILDEYYDSDLGKTWYKIGNDKWIASEEGTWTELYN